MIAFLLIANNDWYCFILSLFKVRTCYCKTCKEQKKNLVYKIIFPHSKTCQHNGVVLNLIKCFPTLLTCEFMVSSNC